MDLRSGIVQSANALGMDPSWLATIISYETGGTFDPMQPGPTTQWGQHRGLIQFGEPQAKQYGVDWQNPLASQLGPDGAVVRYFKDRGWQPGMSFAQAYSTVNAGNPNRLNASDANNGGAPGTVLDKVNNQMAGHWEKARGLLGDGPEFIAADAMRALGRDGGNEVTMGNAQPGLLGNPQPQRGLLGMDPDKRDRLAMFLMSLGSTGQMQPMMQNVQARIDERRDTAKTDAKNNQTVAWLQSQPGGQQFVDLVPIMGAGGALQAYMDARKGGGGTVEYGLTPQPYVDENGDLKIGVIGKDGSFKPVDVPGQITRGIEKIDLGDRWRFVNTNTGEVIGEQVKNIRDAAAEAEIGKATGAATGAALTEVGGARTRADSVSEKIDGLLSDPYLPRMIGPWDSRLPNVSGDANRVQAKIDQVIGEAFLEGRQMLKGGGAITDFESQKAEAAMVRANTAQNEADFRAALKEFQDAVNEGARKLEERARAAGGDVPPPSAAPVNNADPLGLR